MSFNEIAALAHFWQNYPGLREDCFVPRAGGTPYADFSQALRHKPAIAARLGKIGGHRNDARPPAHAGLGVGIAPNAMPAFEAHINVAVE